MGKEGASRNWKGSESSDKKVLIIMCPEAVSSCHSPNKQLQPQVPPVMAEKELEKLLKDPKKGG